MAQGVDGVDASGPPGGGEADDDAHADGDSETTTAVVTRGPPETAEAVAEAALQDGR